MPAKISKKTKTSGVISTTWRCLGGDALRHESRHKNKKQKRSTGRSTQLLTDFISLEPILPPPP